MSWLLVVLAGCGGRPAAFSPGTAWTFPLVDPLADGELIVPVYIEGRGPFLFALDPGNISRVDRAAVAESGGGTDLTLRDVRIGSLTVSDMWCRTIGPHALDVAGRRVVGTIGREVFGEDVVFGFDRARGVAWVSTRRAFHSPERARVIELEPWSRVRVRVDGHARDMAIALGNVASTMLPERWTSGASWTARLVELDDFEQVDVAFGPAAPLIGKSPSDGTLGLDFFRFLDVAIDAREQHLYLSPRPNERDARAARFARWGAPMTSCRSPGCARILLTGRTLHVQPELPDHALELVVSARGHDGVLPDLEVNLAAGAGPFEVELEERYADAELEVIDASPVPRTCSNAAACVVPMNALQ